MDWVSVYKMSEKDSNNKDKHMGGYGQVYKVKCVVDDQQCYAVKSINKNNSKDDRSIVYDVFNEITNLIELQFQNRVVQIIDFAFSDDQNQYLILMSYYQPNLRQFRHSHRS